MKHRQEMQKDRKGLGITRLIHARRAGTNEIYNFHRSVICMACLVILSSGNVHGVANLFRRNISCNAT
jgi:hypothetical protein